MAPSDWIAFWDGKHSIYVSPRHEAAHFRRIADDMARYVPDGGALLDYGCGEALSADRMAARLGRLILCDPAPNVRRMLGVRFAGTGNVTVGTPEDVAAMSPHSIDTVIMHSVAQYLTPAELDALLKMFHRLLRSGGLLVLGDVIPPKLSIFADALALIRFGWTEGFALAALWGLVRTSFSDYRELRHRLGITRYDATDMTARLTAAGFAAEPARTNIGHNNQRMTFLAHAR